MVISIMKFVDKLRKVRTETDPRESSLPLDNIKDSVALSKALLNHKGVTRELAYNYPRPSDIDGACPREWVIGMNSSIKRRTFFHFPLLVTFNIGSAIHTHFQNSKFLFPNIVGWWVCRGCGNKLDFGKRPTGSCPKCGASNKAIRYSEHVFTLTDPFYVSGKIDVVLPVSKDRYRIGDIKGVADSEVEPRGKDIAQLCCYLIALKYDNSLPVKIDTNTGYLFYISKKMSFKAPVRTIKVVLTPSIEEEFTRFLTMVKRGVDEGLIPPKNDPCTNKDCPFKKECNEHGDKNDFI